MYPQHFLPYPELLAVLSVRRGEFSGIFRKFSEMGNRVHIGTPVVDHQIFEVLEEPLAWYEELNVLSPAGVPRWMPDEASPSSSRCIDAIRIASRVKH